MNLRRRALSLAAIAALSLALVPTPALAAAIGALRAWGHCRRAIRSSGATAARGKRTLASRMPIFRRGPRAGPRPTSRSACRSGSTSSPNGSLGNLTTQQINAQITALNAGFGGGEGGEDTGFSFTLAGVTRTNNAVWYASRSGGAEHDMKKALKRGNDGTLNVYTTSAGAFLGWAYLPDITDTAQAYLDGIVIRLGDRAGRVRLVRRPLRRG